VLLPNLTDSLRKAKKEAVSHGMLVFDRTQRQLYYYDSLASEWVAANPIGIVHRDNGFAEIRPLNDSINKKSMSVGLHKDSVATAKLDVNGTVRVRENLRVDQNVQVHANLRVNKSITAQDTIRASVLEGFGITPVGGIIMWNGSPADFDNTGKGNAGSKVENWALCNGRNGTPDLQGRFIVGYKSSDGDYNSIGNTGGEKAHTLSIGEIPSHKHDVQDLGHTHSYITVGGTSGADPEDDTDMYSAVRSLSTSIGHASISEQNVGGGAAHENRPPYYVLAFIMRVR
jgi:hypothetical protein